MNKLSYIGPNSNANNRSFLFNQNRTANNFLNSNAAINGNTLNSRAGRNIYQENLVTGGNQNFES